MTPSMIILADVAETIIGLLVGAVFVVAWIISALGSSKKKRRTPEGAASWQDILRELSGAASGQQTMTPQPPPMPHQPQRPQPQRPQPQQRGGRQKQARPDKGRRRPSAAQPPPVQLEEVMEVTHSSVILPALASPPSAASRPPIASLLMSRQNLRNQIIISEILQPPVSLRDERATRGPLG